MAHRERKKLYTMQPICIFVVVYFGIICISDCYAKVYGVEKRQQNIQKDAYEPTVYEDKLNKVHLSKDFWSEVTLSDEMRTTELTTPTVNYLPPDSHKVMLVLRPDSTLTKREIIESLRLTIARILQIPVDYVKLSKVEALPNALKIYFIYTLKSGAAVPTLQFDSKLTVDRLQNETDIRIVNLKYGDESRIVTPTKGFEIWHSFDHHWKAWQLAIVIACSLFASFSLFLIIYFLSTCRYSKNAAPPVVEERQVVLHPVMKPDVSTVNVIQPENKDTSVVETDSEHTPSPCCSPLRTKGKGLLERRGSNASLTLDLNRSQENVHYGTPPKECSTEEYLLSTGHRLGRRQLHNCLKDVKALHSEFWEIPMNHPEKVEVAGCGTKNRYKTILPNECTRVQLKSVDDDPLSAYINANYIRGYAGEQNAYIATQGPMAHTVGDFWTMIWEQQCPIIVMITKLKEKLKVKCESYVPDTRAQYEGIEITVLQEIPRDGYVIRELLLKKGRESHRVCHFWYTAWPDHKTPDTAKQLLAMALEVDSLRHDGNGTIKGPTVVHCSAGIGRTGCFIAISIGMQQLLVENDVDVLGIVCGLRLDRGGMVQTAEQYEFVHQALSVFELSILDQSGE